MVHLRKHERPDKSVKYYAWFHSNQIEDGKNNFKCQLI